MKRGSSVLVMLGSVLLFSIIISPMMPTAHAGIQCGIDVNQLNYPLLVEPNQSFQVATDLTVTCNQASVAVAGRVDFRDNSTGRLLSTVGFPVGTNPSSPQWSVSASLSSTLTASPVKQVWYLRMVIWLAIGEGVPAIVAGRLEKGLVVQVGEATQGSITSSIQVGQNPPILISSNSSITDYSYDSGLRLINFKASGPNATIGFASVILADYLIDGSPVVLIDNGQVTPILLAIGTNLTSYLISFGYPLSSHSVAIGGSSTIPEFNFGSFTTITSILTLGTLFTLRRRVDREGRGVPSDSQHL